MYMCIASAYSYLTVLQVPNAPSTGASTGSDLNGGAVKNACETLRIRLEEFLDKLAKKPEETFNSYRGDSKMLLEQWKSGDRSWKGHWPAVRFACVVTSLN